MKIAVVILNWNGRELLEQFLPSVMSFSKEADIYLADNASTDESVSFVNSKYPLIKIVQNSTNGGYAKGYNEALKHIEADIYCLLNNDVEVTENWLSPIIHLIKTEPNTAIVQPKILDYKKRNYFEYAGAGGGFIDKYGYPYCRGRIFNTLEKDTGQYDDTIDIFWASGACFFIRSEIYKRLNGFDETFFAHMEEIDLCWRAKNDGFNVKYVGATKVYHLGGATLSKSNPKKTFLNFRNSLYTVTKNAKGPLFPIILGRLILDGVAGIKFLWELKPNHTLAILRAHLNFYRQLNCLIKERKFQNSKTSHYQVSSIIFKYFIIKKRFYKNL